MVMISKLSNKELQCHDNYVKAIGALCDLNKRQLDNVIKRLRMLQMLTEIEEAALRIQIARVR